jgi:eukaryotic-like serine/threonine-protein kinase
MASVKQQGSLQRGIWRLSYAQGIEHQDEAVEALAARPDHDRATIFDGAMDASLGRTLALAGREDEALSYLARAHGRCDRLGAIVSAMRSDLLYGDLLAKRGDRASACNAYRSILVRWGDARPRSVTADQARSKSGALGCAVNAVSAR